MENEYTIFYRKLKLTINVLIYYIKNEINKSFQSNQKKKKNKK